MEVPPLRGPHLRLFDQRIENYALFPEFITKGVRSASRHAAPADRAGLNLVGFAMRADAR